MPKLKAIPKQATINKKAQSNAVIDQIPRPLKRKRNESKISNSDDESAYGDDERENASLKDDSHAVKSMKKNRPMKKAKASGKAKSKSAPKKKSEDKNGIKFCFFFTVFLVFVVIV